MTRVAAQPRVTSPKVRFTVDEYEKMADAGLFDGQRVELINGRIYRMSPQRDPHMFAVANCYEAVLRVRKANELVICQGTVRLDKMSALDPDLMWFAVPKRTPETVRPLPLLIIEVSHTTYKRDSGVKLRKYAEHGVLDYWIVNTKAERVEVYRDPQNPTGSPADCRYASVQNFTRGQSIALLARPHVSLAVNDLLP